MSGKLLLLSDNVIHTSDRDLSAQTVASVVITGIVVVFIGLIILIALVWLYGKIFELLGKKQQKKVEAEKPPQPPKPVAVTPAPPVIEDDIEEETAAVIAAAVAAYAAQTGKKLAVRSIRRSKTSEYGSRNAWSTAGLIENTRPF